ncbi:MAG: helix-turn-helix domain-containing protein [Catenulispora sp.]|nr:helix-turn-helix domain-containing protein [Catenulispora sp.]NUR57259.1 helix-turn-helix domain-containing protein [Catenulispora sp.]
MAFQASAAQQQLARDLKQLRGTTSIKTVEAACGWGYGKISKIENSRIGISQPDLDRLLEYYGVGQEERARLSSLLQSSRTDRWWEAFNRWLNPTQAAHVAWENEAVRIHHAQPSYVPGLLQTVDYATALIRDDGFQPDPDKVDALVALRMQRQARLDEAEPPELNVLLAEAVLWNAYGSAEILTAQLEHLRRMMERPAVNVRIVPFSRMTLMSSIELFELEVGAVVMTEGMWQHAVLDSDLEIKQARRALAYLGERALTEIETIQQIEQRIKQQ